MSKTAVIHARVEPRLKRDAEGVLERIGLSTTEAITLFMHQVVIHKGIPFPIRIPNKETVAAFRENFSGYKGYSNTKEALDELWGSDR